MLSHLALSFIWSGESAIFYHDFLMQNDLKYFALILGWERICVADSNLFCTAITQRKPKCTSTLEMVWCGSLVHFICQKALPFSWLLPFSRNMPNKSTVCICFGRIPTQRFSKAKCLVVLGIISIFYSIFIIYFHCWVKYDYTSTGEN